MSNQSSSRGTEPVNPYSNIPYDRAVNLDQAKACFAGEQNFIAVCDHITDELNIAGEVESTVYTGIISNHTPSELDQSRIMYYGRNASLRELDDRFLGYQTGRLLRLQQQSTATTWGRLTPRDFDTLCRQEQLNQWLNIPIRQQSELCGQVSTLGHNASVPTFGSNLRGKMTAFCGAKPLSFVHAGYTTSLNTQGNEVMEGHSRHFTNTIDPDSTNSVFRTLSLYGDSQEGALARTRGIITGRNRANMEQGVDRSWIEVSLDHFTKVSDNALCNARHFGGLEGANLGRRVQREIPSPRQIFIKHFPS